MADKTIIERLKDLYNLQQIDSQIDEIQVLKGELPMEVKDLEDEIAGLETRMKKLQAIIDELESTISGYEAKKAEASALLERYEKQLDNVANNREYEALTREIDLQKLEIKLADKRIEEALKKLTVKKEQMLVSQEELKRMQENLEEKKKELSEIIEATEKEEKKLRRMSGKAQKEIDERMLLAYQRIRRSYRNGLAVVTVERDACGGCFNKVPPQMQLEVGAGNKIITCEHCGRILVDPQLFGMAAEAE